MRKLLLATASAIAASVGAAHATQSEAIIEPAPPPPCSEELFRQFDFWVGHWEVFATTGQKAGENIISIEENGCLLVERWRGESGITGQSYNYVDLATKKWRQVWVSAGATIDYEGGLNDDGAMFLEGEIAYPTGITANFTGKWTVEEDGSVRQHFQQYDDEKEEWTDWFIGIYKKKSE